jgi:aspartyl-tRNA(Asn)/glutamyl-tRNA(Gln) amidotransferase subunit A
MASLGSDTGGSVRQPADYCGVTGLKPGYGRISRWGLIAYASSFDCVGILAHSVTDVALIYNQLAGPDGKDSTADTTMPAKVYLQAAEEAPTYRLAYLAPTLDTEGLDPEIKTAIEQTLAQLQARGHQVAAVPFPLLEYIVPAYYILTTAEASSNLGRYDGIRYGHQAPGHPDDLTAFYRRNRSEGFGKEVQRRIMLGSFVLSAGYYDAYFTKAQQVRQLIVDATAQIFKEFDAIVMPVSPHVAPRLGEATADPIAMYMADIFTVFANLAGVPAMAIPLFKHSSSMPFGLQVLTNRGEEVLLHQLSAYLERQFARH